jgi:hypothetical protein
MTQKVVKKGPENSPQRQMVAFFSLVALLLISYGIYVISSRLLFIPLPEKLVPQ